MEIQLKYSSLLLAAGMVIVVSAAPALAIGKKVNRNNNVSTNQNANSNPVSIDNDSKTDSGSLIAVAPPSFSYGPGAAAGECVATESYAIGFPIIGGGFGQQTLVLMPGCVQQLKGVLDNAYTDQRSMAAACQSKFAKGALSSLNVDCDAKPVE